MKKILTFAITLIAVLTLCSLTVFAEETYEAKIGDTKYTTIAEAFTAAVDGDTITLNANCYANALLTVGNGIDITLDLNGYSITAEENRYFIISIEEGCKLTINDTTGKGGIYNDNNYVEGVQNSGGYVLNNAGTLIVNGGNFVGDYALYNGAYSNTATATLNGGTFSANEGAYYAIANCSNLTIDGATVKDWLSTSANFIMKRGSVENFVANTPDKEPVSGISTSIEGGTVEFLYTYEGNEVTIGDGANITAINPLAMIGDTYYDSLQGAINAAQENDTIVLFDYITLDSMVTIPAGKKITLDLNGMTINTAFEPASGNECVICVAYGADLTVTDSVGTGVIDGSAVWGGIKLTNTGDDANNGNAKLTVNGGKIIGNYYAIVGNGSRSGTETTINGGTLTATQEVWGYGIFHPQNGTLTVNGGTIEAATGIEMRGGTLTVTGGTIKSNATVFTTGATDSGTTVSGAAIAISQHNTNHPISVTVTGGTLEGLYALYQDRLVKTYSPSTNISATISADVTVRGEVKAAETGYEIAQAEDSSYSVVLTPIEDAFTFLGYSVSPDNTSIVAGYTVVDHDILSFYSVTDIGCAFGIGTINTNTLTSFSSYDYTQFSTFNVKIKGLDSNNTTHLNAELAMALYVEIDGVIKYVVDNTATDVKDDVILQTELTVPTTTLADHMPKQYTIDDETVTIDIANLD